MQSALRLEPLIHNAIDMQLMLIPPGSFWMGAPESEPECYRNEWPVHGVGITRAYYVCAYPVTQREYTAVVGINPAFFTSGKGGGPNHPVEQVSWADAVDFCRRLSSLPAERQRGRIYRLPTEAEWEYACRGGTTTPFYFGEAVSSRQANFNGLYPYGGAPQGPNLRRTTPVGSFAPNSLGLFDLHGQVWEWCADHYGDTAYQASAAYDPVGPPTGSQRVVRGGAWSYAARSCRSAVRYGYGPDVRSNRVGFRVVYQA